MNTIIIFILIIVIVILVLKKLESNQKTEQAEKEKSPAYLDIVAQNYIARDKFFTQSEFMFFTILQEENKANHLLFSTVRFEDVLHRKDKTIKGRGYVKSGHVDFVIVSKQTGKISALIELDGKSHNGFKQKKLDSTKDKIAQNAFGNKFYRIKVGTDFRTQIREIFNSI